MKFRKYIQTAKKNKRLYSAAKFLIKFNFFAIPMYVVMFFGLEIQFLKDMTANIVFFFLKTAGMNAILMPGNLITIPIAGGNWAAFIDWDCTGWKSMYALFALMFASDFEKRKKVLGLLLIPLVYFINIIRIGFMFFYVSSFGLTNFAVVHTLIWSWGLIIIILIL